VIVKFLRFSLLWRLLQKLERKEQKNETKKK
jgi:hypothetical protein